MQFDHQHSFRQPVPADPLRHSRRHILASVLLLLDSDRAFADWSLPQLPHVSQGGLIVERLNQGYEGY